MVYGTYNYSIHGVYKPTFTSLGGTILQAAGDHSGCFFLRSPAACSCRRLRPLRRRWDAWWDTGLEMVVRVGAAGNGAWKWPEISWDFLYMGCNGIQWGCTLW